MKWFLVILFSVSNYSFGKIKYELVQDKLDIVWGMDFLDANTILFTEKQGKIKLLDLKTKKISVISGVPKVHKRGQGGLLDIKKHPNFKQNKKIYFTFSKKVSDGQTTVLASAILTGDELKDVNLPPTIMSSLANTFTI